MIQHLQSSIIGFNTKTFSNGYLYRKLQNLVFQFSFKKFVPHTRMKEIHKLLSSSIYFNPERRYVFLRLFVPRSMDMQIGNRDTGTEFICPEDNCLWLKFMTSYRIVSYLLHFLVSFHLVVISKVVKYTDEVMKAETRKQLIKSYYVTVVFLIQ